ncbi:SanA/YdcF family protein [Leptospira ilyithenensis]|uniref:Membrane permeability protein SanA n=1 Tax=Leptospira ilyithenensis TaxID=2484901 RepID=A0A4R9LKB9_9LEPT|nr:ElyC/SanA/YdcF family protein [Leptospira ilyithenensis]TGN06444.1 membrane permeability protein SanA [Leptospira ilyithenensis]
MSAQSPNKHSRRPFPFRVKWKSLIRVIAIFLLAFFIFIGFVDWDFYRNYDAVPHIQSAEESFSATVALIPGAAVHGNKPSPVLSDRLKCGLSLYQSGKVKKILLSGDNGQADYNELRPMLEFMLANHVKPEDVFVDHAGFRTLDTLIRAKEVFLVNDAIFVSQSFFLPRAIYLGRNLGLNLQAFECNLRTYKKEGYYYWREFFARQLAWWDIHIWDTPPKYLGKPFPIDKSGVPTWKGSIIK